ncbi:MAG: hypothetical protein JO295_07305 [Verrucomicrobia bacterium]|nr:hypothetical protein [Verrucomicrobiota bacterium]
MKTFLSVVVVLAWFAPGFQAGAAVVQWANTGTAWSNGADWLGGTAPTDDTVTDTASFDAIGAAAVNPNLTAARSVNGVAFSSGAYSYTVSGAALTVGSGGIGSGAATSTETFSNALNTSVDQMWTNAGTLNINGTLDLNNSAATARTLSLDGAGATIINGVIQNSSAGSTGNLTYTGSGSGSLTLANANTFRGTTTVQSGPLVATHDGALGSGNVTLIGNSAQLTLQSGTTNNYIADTATLSVKTGTTLLLNFAGTDIVGSFVIDGASQPVGVYTSVNEPGLIFGTGSITVVPEPATWTCILSGLLVLLCSGGIRRRCRA